VIAISKIVCPVGPVYIRLKLKKEEGGMWFSKYGVEILPNSLFPCGSHGGRKGHRGISRGHILMGVI
jgi:hypothetical protein